MFSKKQKVLVKNPAMNCYSYCWVKKFNYQRIVSVLVSILLIVQLIGGAFLFVPKPKRVQANGVSWYDSNWGYRRTITIDNTKIATTTDSFTVLATTTLATLKTEVNGGNVAESNGYDIIWVDDDGTTLLDYEVEKYDPATGEIAYWIKTDISSTTDKTLYMYYGNSVATDQSTTTGAWPDEFKMVQHTDHDWNASAVDSTKWSNDGTNTNFYSATSSVDSWIDKGVDFDGVDDYVDCGNDASLDITGNLTLEAWVKLDSATPGYSGILNKFNVTSGARSGYGIGTQDNHIWTFLTGDGVNHSWLSSGIVADTNWHHITATFDGTTKKIYIDGIFKTQEDKTIGSNAKTLKIGNIYHSLAFPFNGLVDEVRILNITRTDADILTEYNNQSAMTDFMVFGDEVTITIASPVQYQTFQRDSSDQADIPINGTYGGSPTAIEARFNNGDWQTIDNSPSGGNFSGTLTNQSAGQGIIEVRFTNDVDKNTSVADIGIGDVFVIAGQSNAEGRGINAQSYSHATLKAVVYDESDTWKEANDPVDTGTISGSPWPLLATLIMTNENIPIAFITTAAGGTGLVDPAQWTKPASRYAIMLNQINEATGNTGNIKGVLWHQGETDVDNQVSRANYNSALDQLVSDVKSDTVSTVKLIVAQLGYKTTGGLGDALRNALDAIRLAQSDAWDDNEDILAGPTIYDVGVLSDGVHLKTDAELQTLANRWWSALEYHFYNGMDGRGPQLLSAAENADRDEITIVFTDDTLPLLPATGITGFRVEDDGSLVTINSAVRSGNNTVVLALQSALTGTATVSLGSGNDMGNLTDSSTYNLPAESFVDESIIAVPIIGIPTSPSSSSIRWNFTDNTDNETGFRVYDDTDAIVTSSATANLSYLDETSLSENTQYSGRYVTAYNTNGNSASSSDATAIYTLADTPTSLSASADTNNITLSVDSFPNASSDSSGYYFSRSGNNSGWIQTNSWNDAGLTCNTSYTYTVKYRNGDGIETATASLIQSTNGCGGAGPPVGYTSPPSSPSLTPNNPTGEFKVLINNNNKETKNRQVTLNLYAGKDTKRMAVSEDESFKYAGQESYAETRHWTLSEGDGLKTIYVKFYTQYGQSSKVVSDSIILDTAPKPVEIEKEKPAVIKPPVPPPVVKPSIPTKPPIVTKPITKQPVVLEPEITPILPSPAELKPDIPIFTSTQGDISVESIIPQQPLNLTTGLELKTSIKPSKPVKQIKVIIIFKKPKQSSNLNNNNFLSAFIAPLAYAQTWQVAEYILTDIDGDGIYEGNIKMPGVTGEYIIKTTLYYEDGTIEDIETTTLIDPKGYIYQEIDGKELRIPDAKISIYYLNKKTDQFELWPAESYDQENPQITDKTGEYEFLVPQGKYYLTITASDYQDYQSGQFRVRQGDVINRDIALIPIRKFKWQWLFFLIVFVMGLAGGVLVRLSKRQK